jgi:hypothetical protein
MRVLFDADVPVQVMQVLSHVLRGNRLTHVNDLQGWSNKNDRSLLQDAAQRGYEVLVTNDKAQLDDPEITREIKRGGLHHVRYPQRHPGLPGVALAVASLVAAMPRVLEALAAADGQRLVQIMGIDPTPARRFRIVDPQHDPPTYWPR